MVQRKYTGGKNINPEINGSKPLSDIEISLIKYEYKMNTRSVICCIDKRYDSLKSQYYKKRY